jgi:TonB family protein
LALVLDSLRAAAKKNELLALLAAALIKYRCAKLAKMLRCIHASCRLARMHVISFLLVNSVIAQDKQTLPESNPSYQAEAKSLAGRILKRADKTKCHPNSCTILVANFTMPSGSTSRLGIRLADSISAELLAQGSGIRIVDRRRLQDYLVREHIPSPALKDREAARWLASEFQANVVLIGNIEQLGDRFNLLTELLSISNDKVGPQEAAWIAISEPDEAFAPFEPYDAERPGPMGPGAPPSARARVKGTGVPSCTYCPPPQYSSAARRAKFAGNVVLDVTVSEDGRATDARVLKGAPFGLNEQAIRAVNEWIFKPAISDGMPVAVHVPIEMTFRLY